MLPDRYETFHRHYTYPKTDTDQLLPKMSSTCSLTLHACDLVEKNFSLFWVHLGGNSNNTDN